MNRLIHLRFVIALSIVAGFAALGLGTTHLTSSTSEATASQAAQSAMPAAASIPTLPTVVVTANAGIPTLPVVMVTPTAQERLAAADDVPSVLATASHGSASPLMHEMLPHVRLDMPYYSFGKMMPRALKD